MATKEPKQHSASALAAQHRVALWLDRPPWRSLVPLTPVDISSKHLSAFFAVEQASTYFDFASLLNTGRSYRLQIESESSYQSQPMITAELSSKQQNSMGWELLFKFPEDLRLLE